MASPIALCGKFCSASLDGVELVELDRGTKLQFLRHFEDWSAAWAVTCGDGAQTATGAHAGNRDHRI